MLYGILVVLGFMAVIFIFFFTILYYLRIGLNTHDAEKVDPMPKKKY